MTHGVFTTVMSLASWSTLLLLLLLLMLLSPVISGSVPARHISEGAVPCHYCLAPCPNSVAPFLNFFLILNYNFCFCVFRQLTMLADLCSCFHKSPTKLCPDLVSFACWIVPEFWAFVR